MTENQFDELFRNKLKDYSSQVPDNMWERIHPEKDRDRKLFFFWLKYVIVPVFTLAGLAGSFYIGARPAAHHSLSHSSVSSGNGEVSDPARNTNSASKPAIQHTHKTIHPSVTSAFTPAGPLSAPASWLSDAHNPDKAPAFHKALASGHHGSGSPAGSPLLPARSSGILSSPANADSALKHLPLPGIQPIPNTRFLPAIDQLPKTTFSPVKKTATPFPGPKNNILSPLKKGAWSIDLYASPDLPILQIKQEYEKTQLSFTVGLKVNRSFGDHLSAATGMQYSQMNEKIAYNDSNRTNPTRYDYLKRTSFDLPLLFSYGIGSDRFGATLNAGMIFKIHSFGSVYTTATSLYLGLNLSKKINDKISLFAEPYYRYSLPGSSSKSQYYIQRINLTGLSIGLRYNFKRSGRHKQYDTNN